MSQVSIAQILATLEKGLHSTELSQRMLAAALDQLGWPTKEQYSPQEVMTLGLAIAEGARRNLAKTSDPTAHTFAQQVQPWFEVLASEIAKAPR